MASSQEEAVLTTLTSRNHWAFQPLGRPEIPSVSKAAQTWVRTPVDRFVARRQEAEGLVPNPVISPRQLVRRLHFGLIGLPPDPEVVDAFEAAPTHEAYEALVDGLLASPHYGERWGRHWLDVARYADSMGYRFDDDTPYAYAYRDFVIKAFNDDLPYDRFVQWQLAGDEVAPGNHLAMAATGFCAVGPRERIEGNARNRMQSRYDEIDDIAGTTFEAMLGLTMKCARCHDHKSDPISQREYYQFAKAFMTGERREVPMPTPEEAAQLTAWEKKQARANAEFDAWKHRNQAQVESLTLHLEAPIREEMGAIEEEFLANYPADTKATGKELQKLVRVHGPAALSEERHQRYRDLGQELKLVPRRLFRDRDLMLKFLEAEDIGELEQIQALFKETAASRPFEPDKCHAYVDRSNQPVASPFLERGSVDHPGEDLPLGFVSILTSPDYPMPAPPPSDAATTMQRKAVAEWMTDVEKGAGRLLARVFVNRLWHHHFGEGLVRTPNDFGTQGDQPALPDLLDWLADELIEGGWRVKRLHKLILMSHVYRQDITFDDGRAARDPENRFWWRRKPMRLESEILRDSILAVSDRLNRNMHGPGFKLPIPPEVVISRLGSAYPRNIRDDVRIWRRSVYAFVKRTVPIPMMRVFDSPNSSESCGRRIETVVAPQALLLMNDAFVRSRSKDFAARLHFELGENADADQLVDRAFQLAFARPPSPQDLAMSREFLRRQTGLHDGDRSAALTDFCQVLFGLNEFSFVD